MRQQSEAAADQGHGRSSGRRNNDGSAEVPNFPEIKKATAELMKRFKKAELAEDDYNDACAKVAERTHVNTRNLKKLIKASAKGNFVDVRQDVDQQGALFEMVGEVSASGAAEEK